MTTPRMIAIGLVVSLCCACDDDDEGRPRYRADIEVDGASPVSSLGEGDLERICRSYDVYVDTYVSFEALAYVACLPPAIVLGSSTTDCERRLDECMAAFPEPIDVSARLRDAEVCYASLAGCRASVEELEGCINLNLDVVFDIVDNWSCSGAQDRDRRERAEQLMDTASVCADVDAACSDFATFGGPD